MSSRFSPSESRSRSSAPAKTVHVELMRTVPSPMDRERPELVESQVHLVRDVAEVAAAPRGASIVHLKRGHDAVVVDLNRLRILPSDVEYGPRLGEHRVRAESVAENLGAYLCLRERESRPAVARSDARHLLELDPRHGLDRIDELLGGGVSSRRAPRERGLSKLPCRGGGVLDVEDRLVEEADEIVEAQLLDRAASSSA